MSHSASTLNEVTALQESTAALIAKVKHTRRSHPDTCIRDTVFRANLGAARMLLTQALDHLEQASDTLTTRAFDKDD